MAKAAEAAPSTPQIEAGRRAMTSGANETPRLTHVEGELALDLGRGVTGALAVSGAHAAPPCRLRPGLAGSCRPSAAS